MKKLLAIVLSGLLAASVLTGCGSGSESEGQEITVAQTTEAQTEQETTEAQNGNSASFSDADDISYMMIYNPNIYDSKAEVHNDSKSTGDLSKWIDPNANRADGEKAKNKYKEFEQKALSELTKKKVPEKIETDRAGEKVPTYKLGQNHTFKCGIIENKSVPETFKCVYAGDNCYVWLRNEDSSKKKSAVKMGEEFDSKIYEKDVEMFGEPRYADEGGKINIILEPLPQGVLGFFSQLEIFTKAELVYLGMDSTTASKLNTGEAIIHASSDMIGVSDTQDEALCGTLAHEFQHLICGSDAIFNGKLKMASTWLNEAMSTYAGEVLYPGSIEVKNQDISLMISPLIRSGQSLYNFSTETDDGEGDYGVYGSVYLFADYLSKLAGKDVFKNIHDHFRRADTVKTDAEAIYNSVPDSVKSEIDSKISYPSTITFDSDAEEWLSKLTLDFYKNVLETNPAVFERLKKEYFLYDTISPADIEGGGRIIAATKNGSFDVASDADQPMVYIGFDKNFSAVTDPVIK
ncbi:MAG: hypothetical protein IIU14_00620 [Ruminococcus sp.]|nr:hypothetical protein [Ruminococcus sp.]